MIIETDEKNLNDAATETAKILAGNNVRFNET